MPKYISEYLGVLCISNEGERYIEMTTFTNLWPTNQTQRDNVTYDVQLWKVM
jgi:hypothetical protein